MTEHIPKSPTPVRFLNLSRGYSLHNLPLYLYIAINNTYLYLFNIILSTIAEAYHCSYCCLCDIKHNMMNRWYIFIVRVITKVKGNRIPYQYLTNLSRSKIYKLFSIAITSFFLEFCEELVYTYISVSIYTLP